MITTLVVTLLANHGMVFRRMTLGHIDSPAVLGKDVSLLQSYIHAARGLDAELIFSSVRKVWRFIRELVLDFRELVLEVQTIQLEAR